jgi:hypothetical protein
MTENVSKAMKKALDQLKQGKTVNIGSLTAMECRQIWLIKTNQEEKGQPLYGKVKGGPRMMMDKDGILHFEVWDDEFVRPDKDEEEAA